MIVVDTNIIAHFWLPSDHSRLCDQVFEQDPEWIAPVLWISEFRNVVNLYLRKQLIDFSKALQISEKAQLLMKDRQFHVHTSQVLEFANKSDCSSYDCEFVSLADDLTVPLVTLDKQVLKAFPEIAMHPTNFLT
ncbi:MAG: type II toxin-antitoxin system VapC family toxin [Cyclonatronaceae bacterium]